MAQRSYLKRRFDSRGGLSAALRRATKTNKFRTVLVDDLASFATGNITFPSNPSNGDTVTLGGTVVTFGPANVHITGQLKDTLTNLVSFLSTSADVNLIKCTYSMLSNVLTVKYKTPGVKTFTLAASAATVSSATLRLNPIQKRIPL
jgi:hypothetical protein